MVDEIDEEFEKEWCDLCHERNCEAHKKRDMLTYPSEKGGNASSQ
jgi:hypothetical protein